MRLSSHGVLRPRSFSWGHWLVLCLCLGPVCGGLAVEKTVLQDVILRNWDLDDGLPSTRINAIAHTSDGYLWLATHNGLAHFDGTHFVVFDTSNTPGMVDDRVSCLLVDSRGDLWAGTYGGTLLKRTGRVFCAQDLGTAAPSLKRKGGADGKVNALAEDGQGALWLALEGMGLLRFQNGHAEAFITNCSLPSVDVRKLLRDGDGRLWAVAGGQLGIFENGRWRAPDSLPPAAQAVRTINPARDGGLWVTTGAVEPLASRDLHVYKLKKGEWSAQLVPYPWPEDSQQFQRFSLLEAQGGRVWCATAGGIFCRSPTGSWQRLLSDASWQVEAVCMAEDEDGLLWVGTRAAGLVQLQKRQVMTIPLPASDSQHVVLTACSSKDGSLWCGTDGAGIFRWQAEQMTRFGIEQGLSSMHVAALLEDRRTNLWAGTKDGLFRRADERFEPSSGPPAVRKPILALLEDHRGDLWVGGRAGVFRLNAQGWRVFDNKDGLDGSAIRSLVEDREGRIWAGPTDAGLYRLQGERFEHCAVPQEPFLQRIYALHCDAEGTLWIGTDYSGLLRYRAGRFDQWLWPRDGLPCNHLTAILEGDKGDLWMSSEEGIFNLSSLALDRYQRGITPRLQPTRLTVADGLAHKVCSGVGQPAACKSADGRLWFPNGSALAVLDPASIPRTLRVWPPLIEGASVDGVPVVPDAGGLRVRSGALRIDFQYTSPNGLAPEQLRFRFRLEGLDKEWVDAGSRREASYSQLRPGRYQFAVMAKGPEGVWQEGRGVELRILPRWWERTLVQLATGLALLASVAGSVWVGERGRSRRRLARLELQRSLDAERQRIARDIHDDLGSGLTEIILLSDSLDETAQPTPDDLKMVGEISNRARGLTRAMDEVVWAINPGNDTLEGFVNYLGEFTQDYLARADVRCRWNVPTEIPERPLSAEARHNLYLACKEALHNIIKHAGATEVSIRLDLADGGFTLIIEDNGQGFAAAGAPARGNGLSNMRQRLKGLRGLCRVESTPGRGTRILFSLPGDLNKTPSP